MGRKTGLVFQLSDDCADYETPRKGSKKPVLSTETGVSRSPIIAALRNDISLPGPPQSDEKTACAEKSGRAAGGVRASRGENARFIKDGRFDMGPAVAAGKKRAAYGAFPQRGCFRPAPRVARPAVS
jgi:heptaprenyl diphosphate synthase